MNPPSAIPKIEPEKKSDPSVLVPENSSPESAAGGAPEAPKNPWAARIFVILGILGVLLVYFAVSAFVIYKKGAKLAESLSKFEEDIKTQDLKIMSERLAVIKSEVGSLKSSYKLVSWAGFVPYFGGYINDGRHAIEAAGVGFETGETVLKIAEPYSDLLGLKNGAGSGEKDGEKTAQERIDFLVGTIPDLIPEIDKISLNISKIREEVSQIDPERYPEKYNGKNIRSNIRKVQNLIEEAAVVAVNGKPMLENAPYLLGMDSPRNYLVLFQNDKELRPTGGFMTGYSIMKVDKAKFSPTTSDDIYNLDAKYKPTMPAPEPIVKYIKGPYVISKNLRFRDMNWSPDFSVSMADVVEAGKQVGVKDIDGIIAVDTQLLVNLLDVIGPIGVPGFGNFSTNTEPKCNCPQVIYELESYADVEGPIVWDPVSGEIVYKPKNADNRKKIIGPLMNSILANAMGQPKEKLAPLFEAGFKSLMEKHVLFYLMDSKVQSAVSDFGVGGKIRDYEWDYLHINDANLGGRKSNLYVTEEVGQEIEIDKGEVIKTVTITYKNPQKYDGWLNSVLPNWVRIYVPKGSQLLTAEGLEDKTDPYEDLGKTVFAGFFQLRPEGVSKITFRYKLPFKVSKEYKLLIQKQPGTDGYLYTTKLGKYEEEFYLKTDKEIKIGL